MDIYCNSNQNLLVFVLEAGLDINALCTCFFTGKILGRLPWHSDVRDILFNVLFKAGTM